MERASCQNPPKGGKTDSFFFCNTPAAETTKNNVKFFVALSLAHLAQNPELRVRVAPCIYPLALSPCGLVCCRIPSYTRA